MIRKLTLTLAAVVGLSAGSAYAAGGEAHVENYDFSFEGMFGHFDQNQLQRGLKVYTEVCSACHGLRHVAFRTLSANPGPGLPDDQMRAYAATIEVEDADTGDFRPATPVDYFPRSSLPEAPDLSLMTKARAGFHGPYGTGINQLVKGMGGPEYVASILTGYHEAPECAPEDFPGYYNVAFAAGGFPEECKDDHGHHTVEGSWIAMAPPLEDGYVEFDDGAPNDLENMALDTAAFLTWTAEPHLMSRKRFGLAGIVFIGLLSVLLYMTNKRLWAPVKKAAKNEQD